MKNSRAPLFEPPSHWRRPSNRVAVRPVANEISMISSLSSQAESSMKGHYNVLFLCTGNSARSIMAEAILNHKGKLNFTAYSAGSHPSGLVRPEALRQIEPFCRPQVFGVRHGTSFSRADAPSLHFVFTVCDNAAKEVCPIWPSQSMTAHWGIPDPAAVQGTTEQVEGPSATLSSCSTDASPCFSAFRWPVSTGSYSSGKSRRLASNEIQSARPSHSRVRGNCRLPSQTLLSLWHAAQATPSPGFVRPTCCPW
jgi:arsenate reductase (thioredoxin)